MRQTLRLSLSFFIVLLYSATITLAQPRNGLRVKVAEELTKEPVPGAVIKCGKSLYVTDENGSCTLPNVSSPLITLSVRAIGYEEIADRSYPTGKVTGLTILLKESVNMLGNVTVSTLQKHTNTLQQAVTIDRKVLEKYSALSLGHLLELVPGMSSISSGSTIAKPVIQGMYGSRILLINEGVRLESQSWGDDHTPEIDHTGASIIEVIKGAEAVRYGYGAMGGVVLFNQAPLPYGNQSLKVNGTINMGYSCNGKGFDGAGSVEMGYRNIGLRLHGLYQRAGDYHTADYMLNNTGYSRISLSSLIGYHSRRLTATLFASLYSSRDGFYYASNISDINQLLARFEAGRPDEESIHPFSYRIKPPFQQSQHLTLKGEMKYVFSQSQSLALKLSYQNNLREEFENRKQEKYSWLPVQDLQLSTYSSEVVWDGKWKPFCMHSQVGLTTMYQRNHNIPGTKQPAFIPNYSALTTGVFAMHKATFHKMTCSAGIRYDIRAMSVDGYTALQSFKYFSGFRLYRNFTSMLATHYQFNNNLEARINFGWAWRPPDVNELYATGLHHGIYWVVGNKKLTSEHGYKTVLGGKYHNKWLSIEPSIFFQYVNNYIYDNIGQGLDRFHNHPTGKYPKFIYEQDNARFLGGDLTACVVPIKGFTLSAKGEWINARNVSQGAWLPFMPSDRYGMGLNYAVDLGRQNNWHAALSLEGSYVTKQRHFDPEKDLVPDSPPAYALLKGSAELTVDLPHGRSMKLMLLGDNITNNLYKEYTDRFRFYAHARGAQFTLRTIIKF
ncbi:MAG: TonB-dependent receptor [Prevotella sp.]|nr:TonB-dependent receptor [Prevotella sp.]